MQDLLQQQILAHLINAQRLLTKATSDGEKLTALNCYKTLDNMLAEVIAQVEYIVD